MHRPGRRTTTHNWGSDNPVLTIDDLADRHGLGTYPVRPSSCHALVPSLLSGGEVGGQRGTIYSLDLPGVANRGLPVVSPDGPFPTAPSANRAGYFHSTRLSRPSVHLPRPDVPSGTARVLYPLSSPAPLPPVLSITSSVWVLWVLRDLAARAV